MPRLPIARYALRHRYKGLRQLEKIEEADYRRRALLYLTFFAATEPSILQRNRPGYRRKRDDAEFFLIICLQQLAMASQIIRVIEGMPLTMEQKYLRFNNIPEGDCPIDFRFQLADLPRILRNLGLENFQMSNGALVNAQEALLVTLHRRTFPTRFFDMTHKFGGEWTSGKNIQICDDVYIQTCQTHTFFNHSYPGLQIPNTMLEDYLTFEA